MNFNELKFIWNVCFLRKIYVSKIRLLNTTIIRLKSVKLLTPKMWMQIQFGREQHVRTKFANLSELLQHQLQFTKKGQENWEMTACSANVRYLVENDMNLIIFEQRTKSTIIFVILWMLRCTDFSLPHFNPMEGNPFRGKNCFQTPFHIRSTELSSFCEWSGWNFCSASSSKMFEIRCCQI